MSVTPSIASLQDYSPDSRVWVYQSNRTLGADECSRVSQALESFCRQWTAHNLRLKAVAEVVEDRIEDKIDEIKEIWKDKKEEESAKEEEETDKKEDEEKKD